MQMKNGQDKTVPLPTEPFERQRRELLSLSPEKALERILASENPAGLVQALPDQDLYWLVHDIGPEDALPLMSLSSDQQQEFILDMEIWQRDRIEPLNLSRWFDRLYRADARRTVNWLIEQETELLEFYLYNNIDIKIREHDQDPAEFGTDYFTFDNVFYIRIAGPLFAPESELSDIERQNVREFLEKLVTHIANFDHITYQKLLLEVMYCLPAESEEEMYRLRGVRLAEKGFLPFEEAVGVYQPLKPQQIPSRSVKSRTRSPLGREEPIPLYPVSLLEKDTPFAGALSKIGTTSFRQQLQIEFAALCNRIIAADLNPVHSKEELRAVVKKACGFLALGLDALAAGPGSKAHPPVNQLAAVIQRHRLADIFRVGYGRVLELKRRAQTWLTRSWFAEQGLSLAFWGEAGLGLLGGLLIKKPMFFDNYQTGRIYRDFSTIDELRQTEKALESIIHFDNLLSRLEIDVKPLSSRRLLNHKNLLLTLWALDRLGSGGRFRPLTLVEFRTLFADLWQTGAAPRRVRTESKAAFLRWLCRRSGLEAEEVAATLGPELDALFAEVEEEYGRVQVDDLDPRHIYLFLLEP